MNARTWRMGTLAVLLVSLVAMAGWGQGVAPKGIIPTPPESTSLQVSIWVDRGAYTVGDPITIHYTVNRPAYVYICDIQPDGQWAPAFPNNFAGGADNYVAAGEHTVPGNWSIVPPPGTEYLQILATTSPVDPFSLTTGDAAALLAEIQTHILDVLPVTERTWSFASFDIVEGSTMPYGKLNISSTPPAASIYVDGMYVGYTPRSIYVRPGYRNLMMTLPGYQTRQQRIYVIGLVPQSISWGLQLSAPANQPPVSVFVYSPPSPAVGEWIQFNGSASSDPDGTIPASSYAWNFGDGTTDTQSVRMHHYLAAGNYPVTLTVTDNLGASATSSQIVHVGAMNQLPIASFVTDPVIGTPGGWIQFNASASSDSDGIASYAWNYGDGRTSTVGPTDWHQYSSAGSYTVTLTVTDNLGAAASTTRVIQIGSTNQPPTAAFTVPTPLTVSAPARFDASASVDPDGWIVSYQWSYGDGTTAQGPTSVAYKTYGTTGTFPVTLTVTDNGGATNSTTQLVQVGSPLQAPVALITYSPSSPVVGMPVVFDASSSYDPDGAIVSRLWDFNGDGSTDASGATAPAIYSTPGTALVRLTVTDNSGLSSSSTQTIVVSPAGGGSSGAPAMGSTPGFFVWGSDSWHITVNAGAGWTAPHNFRIELRTDRYGQFTGVNEVWSGGVAPMGIIPTPSTSGRTVVFEASIQSGSVDYTFTIPGSKSMWLSFKMDLNGDGVLEESTSFIYLRGFMVHPPSSWFGSGNPFVVGLPNGATGPLVPSMNFQIGTAPTYNAGGSTFIAYITSIGALENL